MREWRSGRENYKGTILGLGFGLRLRAVYGIKAWKGPWKPTYSWDKLRGLRVVEVSGWVVCRTWACKETVVWEERTTYFWMHV